MKKQNNSFEEVYASLLVEFLLKQRDKNPLKNWGHIWGKSSIYAYTRWNLIQVQIPLPELYFGRKQIFGFPVISKQYRFTQRQQEYIEKFQLFDEGKMFGNIILQEDREVFPLISLIGLWYQSGFSRRILLQHGEIRHYLYYFMFAISDDIEISQDYYFRFSERLSMQDFEYLKKSYLLNGEFLFTHIALASYLFHNQALQEAEMFYQYALHLDKDNPYILCKYSNLLLSFGKINSYKKAERLMEKVVSMTDFAPWSIQYFVQVKNALGEYFQTIEIVETYYEKRKNIYKTFEPYLFRSFAYMNVGDFYKCRQELEKIEKYYFGEGYMFLYQAIKVILNKISSRV